jgi:hypothetical protein
MNTTNKGAALPVTIKRNGIGSIALEPGVSLQAFAEQNAGRVASMLHVLMQVHQQIDGGFMTDMLEIANDMAYQVQQALELMDLKGGTV